jgi:hypothetical protein
VIEQLPPGLIFEGEKFHPIHLQFGVIAEEAIGIAAEALVRPLAIRRIAEARHIAVLG